MSDDGRTPDTLGGTVEAPWSGEQVASLNGFQRRSNMHPFTCGNGECPGVGGQKASLVAGGCGWRCPADGCGYTQDWAHGFMADWSWKPAADAVAALFGAKSASPSPVLSGEPWPPWLEGQSPERRVAKIVQALAACCADDHAAEPAAQHCTATMAERFLLRLLAEARQPSPVPSGDRLARRVAELARLQAGWLDGDGLPPDPVVLGLAGDVARELAAKGIAARLFPVPDGGISLEWGDGTAGVTLEPAGLRDRISEALDESVDSCARCKVCDNQLDAVMAIVAFEVLDRDLRREQADARMEALRADVAVLLDGRLPGVQRRDAEGRLRAFAAAGAEPTAAGHAYLSTSCLHASEPGREGLHAYCSSPEGRSELGEHWVKTPSSCKHCGARCQCQCHRGEGAEPALPGPAPLDLRRFHAPCDPGECPAAARLAELEGALTWGTKCLSCSRLLDSGIGETERAERAEAQLARAVAGLTRLSLLDPMTGLDEIDGETPPRRLLVIEMQARREHAAGVLEIIRQLGQLPVRESSEENPAVPFRQRDGDQPLPVRNDSPDVQSMVIADIGRRRELGVARYGTALQPHNGRDSLRDLYEELLDACCYARQVIAERGAPAGES